MIIIYSLFIFGTGLLLITLLIIISKYPKKLIPFLYRLFQLFFGVLVITLFVNILFQFTESGNYNISETQRIGIDSHHSKGYNVPVHLNISFDQKKLYELKTENGSYSFTKDINPSVNRISENSDFHKNMLNQSGITQHQLDSIFEFSDDVKVTGKKLLIGEPYQEIRELTANTSSFHTKGFLNIKSKNLSFKILQVLNSYYPSVFVLFILYQTIVIFKLLKEKIQFTANLSKRIKWIGTCLILWEVMSLILSYSFSFYYSYAGFEMPFNNEDIQLSLHPRLDFDFTIFIIGICLLVLKMIFERANTIQQENDLTI